MQWRRGLRAISKLGSLDDTALIVEIISAFNGNSRNKQIAKWAKSEVGQRYINGDRLCHYTTDYKNSDNTLGKALCDLNYEIGELVPSNIRATNVREAWGIWNVDTHDVSHIVSGYGTDGLGELLRAEHAKDYEGRGWRVVRFIIKMRFWVPYFFKNPKLFLGWRKQIKEARKLGKRATPYLYENWFEYLDRDLDAIRQYQHITPPSLYT
jgi:hypothetical protein